MCYLTFQYIQGVKKKRHPKFKNQKLKPHLNIFEKLLQHIDIMVNNFLCHLKKLYAQLVDKFSKNLTNKTQFIQLKK